VDDAVPLVHLHGAVVHRDGHGDLDGLLALLEDADQVLVDAERLADAAELRPRKLVGILAKVGWRRGGAHRLLRASRTTPGTVAQS
jgi:hypothetical protein